MEHSFLLNYAISLIISCFAIAIYSLSEGAFNMDWWLAIIVAVIPALITGLFTAFVSRKSQIKKNTATLEKLTSSIGEFEKGTLSNTIGADSADRSIVAQIGITANDKSLTGQHKDIMENLKMIMDFIASKSNDEKLRFAKFTAKQKDTKKKVEEISDFLKDWERLNSEVSELRVRLAEKEAENKILYEKIRILSDSPQLFSSQELPDDEQEQ